MTKKRVLSGVQPTGNLHIGNYFGAIKQFVEMQNSGEFPHPNCSKAAFSKLQPPNSTWISPIARAQEFQQLSDCRRQPSSSRLTLSPVK